MKKQIKETNEEMLLKENDELKKEIESLKNIVNCETHECVNLKIKIKQMNYKHNKELKQTKNNLELKIRQLEYQLKEFKGHEEYTKNGFINGQMRDLYWACLR